MPCERVNSSIPFSLSLSFKLNKEVKKGQGKEDLTIINGVEKKKKKKKKLN